LRVVVATQPPQWAKLQGRMLAPAGR
jgi:hypothetical protein